MNLYWTKVGLRYCDWGGSLYPPNNWRGSACSPTKICLSPRYPPCCNFPVGLAPQEKGPHKSTPNSIFPYMFCGVAGAFFGGAKPTGKLLPTSKIEGFHKSITKKCHIGSKKHRWFHSQTSPTFDAFAKAIHWVVPELCSNALPRWQIPKRTILGWGNIICMGKRFGGTW